MVDRYAKYAMEHLAAAANRIQKVRGDNVIDLVIFTSSTNKKMA